VDKRPLLSASGRFLKDKGGTARQARRSRWAKTGKKILLWRVLQERVVVSFNLYQSVVRLRLRLRRTGRQKL